MNYLLLDGAQVDNLIARIYEVEPVPNIHLLYQRTRYEELADVGPLLVAVQPASELVNTFAQHWQATAGIWLESDASEDLLVQHLRSLVHAQVEGVTVLLRYYDPRITALWLGSLSDSERDVLMGPISRIRLSGTGQEAVLQRSNPTADAARYDDTPWLKLSSEQLEHMTSAKEGAFAQQLLAHLQRYYPESLNSLDTQGQQQWVSECRASAARYGYSRAVDVSRWAGLVAQLGRDFPTAAQHETYRLLLEQKGTLPEQRLDNLINELQRQLALTDKDSVA